MKLNKILRMIAIVPLLCATAVVSAQNKAVTVSGKVVDKTGEPVISAGVFIKGTTVGTVTDFDGKYTLANVPADAVLTASNLGYTTAEQAVNGKTDRKSTRLNSSHRL